MPAKLRDDDESLVAGKAKEKYLSVELALIEGKLVKRTLLSYA